jgi:hypothetical protein
MDSAAGRRLRGGGMARSGLSRRARDFYRHLDSASPPAAVIRSGVAAVFRIYGRIQAGVQ